MAAAFAGAGKNDPVQASAWLKTHPVQTVMGAKSWDKKGDLTKSDYVVYEWNKDGKYQQLP